VAPIENNAILELLLEGSTDNISGLETYPLNIKKAGAGIEVNWTSPGLARGIVDKNLAISA